MEEYEIELELTKLMTELQQNEIKKEEVGAPYLKLIKDTTELHKLMVMEYSEKSVNIQENIKELTLIRGKSLKTGSGNIIYIKGAVRRNWDLDALDTICEIDKYVKENIWKFREEKEGEPQVRIKIETSGKSVTNI